MNDDAGLAEALLGLDGFRVLEVTETPHEVVIAVETTADYIGCARCGTRAVAHERKLVAIRDLACFGRPARLVWRLFVGDDSFNSPRRPNAAVQFRGSEVSSLRRLGTANVA